jgi:hypothetical protein
VVVGEYCQSDWSKEEWRKRRDNNANLNGIARKQAFIAGQAVEPGSFQTCRGGLRSTGGGGQKTASARTSTKSVEIDPKRNPPESAVYSPSFYLLYIVILRMT